MDDRSALMAAIMANPGEDTPRLALADWLQEHGDKHDQARAEFIRFQVRAARAPQAEVKMLEAAEGKLEKKHRAAWLKPLTALGPRFEPQDYQGFKRGTFAYAFFDTSEFLLKKHQAVLPDVLSRVGVEELCFYSPTKKLADFANAPAFRWTSGVQYPGADDAALKLFAASDTWAHLSRVEFQELVATDAGLRAFAETTKMRNLARLELSTEGGLSSKKPRFTAAGVAALVESKRLPALAELSVETSAPRFEIGPLFAAPGLKKLRKLTLQANCRLADVAASKHLTKLESLVLHEIEISPAEARAFVASRGLSGLKELVINARQPLDDDTYQLLRAHFGARFTDG